MRWAEVVRALLVLALLGVQGCRAETEAKAEAETEAVTETETETETETDWASPCASCHGGIESPGDAHAGLSCETCHVEPLASARDIGHQPALRPEGHPDVAANPSHPSTWESACGPCHPGELSRMQRSLHWTQTGIIAHTRYLWGAQDRVVPELTLEQLAGTPPAAIPETSRGDPAALVDDLLRRRCLRCHLAAPGDGGEGLYRGAGCAACHVPYADDGLYAGADEAVRGAGTRGRPREHRILRPTGNDACLRCHHGDATGADYVGLFPADAHDEFRVPLEGGEDRPLVRGRDQHRLTADLHADGGLTCVDCHGQDEVMGPPGGPGPALAHEAVGVRCTACHGDLEGWHTGTHPAGLAAGDDGGWTLTLRHGGGERIVPQIAVAVGATVHPAHEPTAHSRLTCAACHSSWAGQAFGRHLHLSMVPTWNLWIPRDAQGDPELSRRVAEAEALDEAARADLAPRMTDRITGEERDGLWAGGHSLRRWEEPALGMTPDGRIAPFRPRHLYQVTHVAADGLVYLDSAVPRRGDGSGDGWASEPFTPHTTLAKGALCTRCHGNPRAAGLGLAWSVDAPPLHAETPPVRPATPGARPLDDRAREALLDPSSRQRAAFAHALREMGLEAWLPEPEGE